jgi:PAS domain S-box-containing protein/putative nucleotidyltransferase with HDIG domain
MIMHPYRSDLDGTDISGFKDPNGKRLFVEFVKTVQRQGAGYIDYMWQWKDDPKKIVPKISYVKGFPPWGWIVGTGLYIDDVHAEIAAIRNRLSSISLAILLVISLLALYSIRQSLLADRERQRIFADREKILKSLEESEKKYRNLIETTSDWIWESDQAGKYTYSSPQVFKLIGYRPEELLGSDLMLFAAPEQAAGLGDAFAALLSGKSSFSGFEVPCQAKSGQTVVLEFNAVPIIGETGDLSGFRGVARDITERRTAMELLKKSRDDLHASLEETVTSLASTAEKRDPYTAGHQQRVERLACAIAREQGFPEDRIEGLHIASLLHDIGKITLPSEYLAKPTMLSKEEKAVIRCHPEVGYEILKNIQFPWPVAEIVYQHHEHLDGSGYPRGLTDGDILPEAKILAVADVVEAMSSHRPYRPSLGLQTAIDEIRSGRGTRYHAESVDACLRLIEGKRIDLFMADTAREVS